MKTRQKSSQQAHASRARASGRGKRNNAELMTQLGDYYRTRSRSACSLNCLERSGYKRRPTPNTVLVYYCTVEAQSGAHNDLPRIRNYKIVTNPCFVYLYLRHTVVPLWRTQIQANRGPTSSVNQPIGLACIAVDLQ
jgi:hypothetical protein